MAFGENAERRCQWCGDALPTRRHTVWCSDECSTAFSENHFWTNARNAALRRDGWTCVHCIGLPVLRAPQRREFGWDDRAFDFALTAFDAERARRRLEVNHVVPRVGRGYGFGCHHHLANLETLCHEHHRIETSVQRDERRGVQRHRQLQLIEVA